MGGDEAHEPQLSEMIERLIAETKQLIEECRLLAREIETTKQELGTIAKVPRPKAGQSRSSEANKKLKETG